jgi:hypothetical protein
MDCKEALLKVLQRQTEGLMYHDQMSDYYAFLKLDVLKHLHKHQAKEELDNLRKMKCTFIDTFGMLPFYSAGDPKVIPVEWKNKTNAEIDETTLKMLIKSSITNYVAWEKATCEIYKEVAHTLHENMHFPLYRHVCDLIEEVQKEIIKAEDMVVNAASYNYCPSYFK